MDETTKLQLKGKFYWLAIQLNIIILLVAMSVLSFFLVPAPYRIPAIICMPLLALLLVIRFRRNYRAAKAWLEEHADKDTSPRIKATERGDATQTDIKGDDVIQRSMSGTEIPVENKVCPQCHQTIHNEKFCPECGQDLR
ncbi:MAG: hypothetical protein NTZ39_02765 [Methanoregula sp.]|nr:hypothetical protein [Methanoregula sp.]